MDIGSLVDGTIKFFSDHTLWAVMIVLAIVAFVYWKPKDMFKLVMAGLTLGVLIYIFSFIINLTSEGIDKTRKFTNAPRIQSELEFDLSPHGNSKCAVALVSRVV